MDKSSLWILLFKILIINNIYREIDQKNLILKINNKIYSITKIYFKNLGLRLKVKIMIKLLNQLKKLLKKTMYYF